MSARRPITAEMWLRRPPLRFDLRGTKPAVTWWWATCGRWGDGCWHQAAIAIAPYVIRWGPDAWMDELRRHGRCSACGHRGLNFQHPSWGGTQAGWMPFPVERMGKVP